MTSYPPAQCCTVGFRHEGASQGNAIRITGGKHEAYLATPPPDKAKNRLLADEFASNGYLTLLLDTFNGDPLPVKAVANDEVDIFKWLTGGSTGDNPHNEPAVDPIVLNAIKALREEYGVKKLGAVGILFGHWNDGIDAGHLADLSFMDAGELAAINGPVSIAAAETDHIFPAEKRHETEDILIKNGKQYQLTLYSKVAHGFATRCDLSK
ncbi:hypothetical protein BKA60DRAFT_601687 [Fusarium oxysporum]|nr:hypothetical protein BKA60DRAFT_601687 [Fusarium oxysporum]